MENKYTNTINTVNHDTEKRIVAEEKEYKKFLDNNIRNCTKIIEIEKVEERPFYDTRWLITFQGKHGAESICIVRQDLEMLTGLCNALNTLHDFSKDSISTLV